MQSVKQNTQVKYIYKRVNEKKEFVTSLIIIILLPGFNKLSEQSQAIGQVNKRSLEAYFTVILTTNILSLTSYFSLNILYTTGSKLSIDIATWY